MDNTNFSFDELNKIGKECNNILHKYKEYNMHFYKFD